MNLDLADFQVIFLAFELLDKLLFVYLSLIPLLFALEDISAKKNLSRRCFLRNFALNLYYENGLIELIERVNG